MNTTPNTLALLIDGDNAKLSYTKQIIQFCERYGTLKIKKAYGDWNQPNLSSHHQKLIELGVNPIPQPRVGKNATDLGLAMDVALMLEKGEANIYVIVSSDNDFATMCERIHLNGAKVIVIGSKKPASKKLRHFCDQYFNVGQIVKSQSKLPAKFPASPKPKSKPSSEPTAKSPALPKLKTIPVSVPSAKSPTPSKPKTKPNSQPTAKSSLPPESKPKAMLEILIEAYQKMPRKDGWVLLAHVGNVLRQIDKQFNERFANKRLSTWFKDFPDKFEVSGDMVRMK